MSNLTHSLNVFKMNKRQLWITPISCTNHWGAKIRFSNTGEIEFFGTTKIDDVLFFVGNGGNSKPISSERE